MPLNSAVDEACIEDVLLPSPRVLVQKSRPLPSRSLSFSSGAPLSSPKATRSNSFYKKSPRGLHATLQLIESSQLDYEELYTIPEIISLLCEYLAKSKNEEIILFLKDVEEFKKPTKHSIEPQSVRAKRIVEKYLLPTSPYEINVGQTEKKEVLSSYQRMEARPELGVNVRMFDALYNVVMSSLLHDVFPRFVQTESFKKYITTSADEPTLARVLTPKSEKAKAVSQQADVVEELFSPSNLVAFNINSSCPSGFLSGTAVSVASMIVQNEAKSRKSAESTLTKKASFLFSKKN